MVKIQIDLEDKEDKIVELFKAEHRLEKKEEAIKEIIKRSDKCSHKFEILHKDIVNPNIRTRRALFLVQRCVICGETKKETIPMQSY